MVIVSVDQWMARLTGGLDETSDPVARPMASHRLVWRIAAESDQWTVVDGD
jgi:hypothetical protein